MKIYYLEFENSVKFCRNDATVEIEKSKLLELFLKAVYKKYGKKVKFESLVWKKNFTRTTRKERKYERDRSWRVCENQRRGNT